MDPIIYRDPLRTPQFDSTYLNNPSFVGSFDDEDFVYFFFREGNIVIGIDSFFPQEQLLQYYESSKFKYVPCFKTENAKINFVLITI